MIARPCPGGVYGITPAAAATLRPGSRNVTLWSIDGAAANSREPVFAALAAALAFPDYFGHNWDATYDCLTDLAGGSPDPAVLLIADGPAFLTGMGAEWDKGRRVFADAAAFWQQRDRLLLVLLETDASIPGVPDVPPSCLEPLMEASATDTEISAVERRISALNRAGELGEALKLGQDLARRYPDSPRAHFILAGVHDFQGREAEAVPVYQRALTLGLSGDELQRFYVQYGSTLRNVAEFAESVRVLREGHQRYPDDAAIQAFLALALFSAGEPAAALATALSVLADHAGVVDLRGYERALREYVAELRPPAANP